MAETKVVILAAGKGKRMGASVPKPLVEIAGKPMIAQLIERVEKAGIDEKPVVIVSPDGKGLFEEQLGNRVELSVQPEAKGTGDALRYAEEACKGAKRVIVLYGDHPFIGSDVLRSLVDLSKDSNGDILMLTATVPNFEGEYSIFKGWGRIIRENGEVIGIKEAKDCTAEELDIKEVNPGIYDFPIPWAFEQLRTLKNENASSEFYLVDLISMAMKEGRRILSTSVNPLEVVGVNTPEELVRAEQLLKKTL